jgi:hypothetical protein
MASAKSLARYWFDWPFRFKSRKDRRLTLGNALLGGLRLAANEKNIPVWLEAPLIELVSEKGRVTGTRRKAEIRSRAQRRDPCPAVSTRTRDVTPMLRFTEMPSFQVEPPATR